MTATRFLDTLITRMPFRIAALQVDGGSEFAAAFEAACQQRGIRLFVLPPRSPKLNGRVERANRTHTEEFYESYPRQLRSPPCAPPNDSGNRSTTTCDRIKRWAI